VRFRLRNYQQRSLAVLESYLRKSGELGREGPKIAFIAMTDRPYKIVPRLEEMPYVCIRVPTGGGKTIMAAHAVGIAAKEWIQRDRVVCLWLVPSKAILDQTLARLKTPGDPYHDALLSRFGSPVIVMDLGESLFVQRSVLDGETVVIVATLAALRVTDTEGRKVYEAAGALEHHFDGGVVDLMGGLYCVGGRPVPSLANVLYLRHPIVIVDEAHNARTQLSFETLARFAPSCVLEFTATPSIRHAPEAGIYASNVLAHVSAAELKAEEMIKLPVRLRTRSETGDAIADALAKQRELEGIAQSELRIAGEYIRPIVLFQAQPNRANGSSVTAPVLKQILVDDHRVPADQIAIETGDTRELVGIDLNDPACPIRFVITVQALREGWDCPFAYVLCSIAEQTSARAVEQILGRVLRLPGAKRKQEPALNDAYAYVVSNNFATAAEGLRDALVEAGFEKLETEAMVQQIPDVQPSLFYPTRESPISARVAERPNHEQLRSLPAEIRDELSFDDATMTLAVTAPLTLDAEERLVECFSAPLAKATVRRLARESREGAFATGTSDATASTRLPIRVPQIAVDVDGQRELFEDSHFLGISWRLSDCDAELSETQFASSRSGGQQGQIDITDAGRLEVSFRDTVSDQLALLEGEPGWTPASLTVWLDAHIPHRDLGQEDVQLFIRRAIDALVQRTGSSIEQLAREKSRLQKAVEARIDEYRAVQRRKAFQSSLFGDVSLVTVSQEVSVLLGEAETYAPNWVYEGPYRFQKHVLPQIGELAVNGEEHECAIYLDQHSNVDRWIRNLSSRSDSFWLQTSTDKFYPDFVGLLKDGRVFAVEYKGSFLWSNDDSKEKRVVGELWAERSGGICVFVMPDGRDWAEIDRAFDVSQ
jgi:type III restriction enzyme